MIIGPFTCITRNFMQLSSNAIAKAFVFMLSRYLSAISPTKLPTLLNCHPDNVPKSILISRCFVYVAITSKVYEYVYQIPLRS
jgi:hypothetical protein